MRTKICVLEAGLSEPYLCQVATHVVLVVKRSCRFRVPSVSLISLPPSLSHREEPATSGSARSRPSS